MSTQTHVFYLAPTGPGVGLTSVSIGLVRALDRVGMRVHFCKPIGQPQKGDEGPERSTSMLRQIMNLDPPTPIDLHHAELLMSEGNQDDLMEEVVAKYQQTAADADVVIVEGLVPTLTQSYADQLNAAIAETLDAEIILVSALGDGTPAELDERIEITARLFGGLDSPKVIGGIINKINRPRSQETGIGISFRPTNQTLTSFQNDDEEFIIREKCRVFQRPDFYLLGCIPWRQRLLSPRTLDITRHTEAKLINEGDQYQRRVNRFAVCARSIVNVLEVLQPGVLIVTPGDRDDVILAVAMAAMNGVPLAGLLLTSGYDPDPRILNLCEQAISTGLPIMVVPQDTYQTASMLQHFNNEVPLDDHERIEWVMDSVARRIDSYWLKQHSAVDREPRMSPPAFRFQLSERARAANKRIILPEGDEPRTIQAATICHERNIARCILVGEADHIQQVARKNGVELPRDIQIIEPNAVRENYIHPLVEFRKHRGLTEMAARDYLQDNVVLATMMLALDEVDGLVSGAVHTTANTIRPALQIIKTKPEAKLVSSVFFMCLPEQVLVYGDCAINPDPNAEELADIALQSADSAAAFGIPPRVAMISYSTGTSGSGSEVEKVREATRIAKEKRPDLLIDGPLQYDAAVMADVAAKKAPESQVAGKATVFIFPDLNTGNTTYKAVQRSANVVSIGPMLQGLRKPVNDLSRGALVDDIVYTIALTAIQAHSNQV